MELKVGDYVETNDFDYSTETYVCGVIGYINGNHAYIFQNEHQGSHPSDVVGDFIDMMGYECSWIVPMNEIKITKKTKRSISINMLYKLCCSSK